MAHLLWLAGHGCNGRGREKEGERKKRKRRGRRKKGHKRHRCTIGHWLITTMVHFEWTFVVSKEKKVTCHSLGTSRREVKRLSLQTQPVARMQVARWVRWVIEKLPNTWSDRARRGRKNNALNEQMKYEDTVAGVLFAWYKCNLNYCLHQWLRLFWEAKVKEAMSLSRARKKRGAKKKERKELFSLSLYCIWLVYSFTFSLTKLNPCTKP